jgi:flagella basal body P-ring formation protein FlgA
MLNINSNAVLHAIRSQYPTLNIYINSTVTAVRWTELTLSNDRITSEAKNFLARYYQLTGNAEINIINIPTINIPCHSISLIFEKSRTTENTNFSRLDGKVIHNGNIIRVFNVIARVQDKQIIYRANRSIRQGEKISLIDLSQTYTLTNPNNQFAREISHTSDFVANNFIARGATIRSSDIITAPQVKRNELVTVLVQSNTISVTTKAVARADGRNGDRIMMQNPESRQTFFARVIDRNTVLINLEDQ